MHYNSYLLRYWSKKKEEYILKYLSIMNKNKLILGIIVWIIIVIIIWIVANLNSTDTKTWGKSSNATDYSIWLYQDDADGFIEVLNSFKTKYPQYTNTTFNVESFSDYEDYTYALQSAFAKESAPDLFVLNNSEKQSILWDYTYWINPTVVNPNDFRKKYLWVFSEDLIEVTESWDWDETKKVEYLKWLPVWYETLGIYYNKSKRYNRIKTLNSSTFESIGSLNSVISSLKEQYPNAIPLAIWNGSTVRSVSDIISQFFLLENGITSIDDITWWKMKSALTSYMLYWDISENNAYNTRMSDMVALNRTWLDLFTKSEALMMVGYPRLLSEIDKKGFNKKFLGAASFPFHNLSEWKTLLNYNYFVKSKLSENSDLSDDLLGYLSTDTWVQAYLEEYPYYLSSLMSLESDVVETKILNWYYITLWDFYNPDHLLQSFDVGVKSIYDKEIVKVLDDTTNYIDSFTNFQSKLTCKTKKYLTLENLSLNCE